MHKYANLGDTVCFWFGANTDGRKWGRWRLSRSPRPPRGCCCERGARALADAHFAQPRELP